MGPQRLAQCCDHRSVLVRGFIPGMEERPFAIGICLTKSRSRSHCCPTLEVPAYILSGLFREQRRLLLDPPLANRLCSVHNDLSSDFLPRCASCLETCAV